jgi:2-oxoglutarate dehydrogenase E2 component (dihydrolipoamide succinyltransferase)
VSIEVKVPSIGESITEVEIGEWLKAEGDAVKQDETLAMIESEKATVELPAPASGRLTKILKQKGEPATVGEVIAHMEAGDVKAEPAAKPEPTPPKPSSAPPPIKPAAREPRRPEAPPPKPAPAPSPAKRELQKPTPPPAERRREEKPPELPGKPAPSTAPEPEPPAPRPAAMSRQEQVVRMTLLRRTVAKRLVEAQHAAALLTTFNEADLSAVLALRKQHQEAFQQKYSVKLGLMSFFVKAAISALKLVPQLNAEVRETDIVYRNYHDIGIAVSTDRGLVVPVLRDADRLGFAELEQAIADFARRARENTLRPEELEGGTFTITNGGVFGSLLSTPLVNPPQSGILGMHTIQERPVAVAGQVVIRPMMYLALTYDHRIVDGRQAVLFLVHVKEAVESPARMLLEV